MKRLLIFLFTALPLSAHLLTDRLLHAKPGDYTVFEAHKMATLLIVRPTPTQTLIFEEITVPLSLRPPSWPQWIAEQAPGHTSWSILELDPKANQILECYSFSRNSWVELAPNESLVATLLTLPLTKVPSHELRRIGPPPLPGEADHRQIWSPAPTPCTAYTALWPDDGSELAHRSVLLYFNETHPFPLWIEVITPHIIAPIRALTTGHLTSTSRPLPRRLPEILSIAPHNNTLEIELRSPRYYRAFELFALDITDPKQKTVIPLSHTQLSAKDRLILQFLTEDLTPNHLYHFLILPVGYSDAYVQSDTPYHFQVPSI